MERFTRLWSDAKNWPNSKVPEDGEELEIPCEWNMKLDVDTANLDELVVNGRLYFDDTRALTKLRAKNIWVRKGQILAGT